MGAWTKCGRILGVALGTAALAFAGCGDDDDGGGGGGDNNGTGPGGGGTAITQANVGVVYASTWTALSSAMQKGAGTHNGARSGTVTISVGKPTQSMTYRMAFDNYSDDGVTVLDGTVSYAFSMTGTSVNYTYTGDLDISGTYEGDVEINLTGSSTGMPSGYVRVNGTRYNITNGVPAMG
ncbi:MAG: hypothetical protein AB1505_04865 [Candidatus Latescibacterota bacterium]